MSKKQILILGFLTIIFFLIFVKPWNEDYYFPILLFTIYFFSVFIKNGLVKYYSTICILTLLVIIQDSWLTDYSVPILLIIIIISDVLYQLINLIQAFFFKKFDYKLINLLIQVI